MTQPNGYSTDEQRLRDALRRAADEVTPSPGGLERIRARVHRPPWYRRPLALGLAGATATAALVVAATLLLTSKTPSDDVAGDPPSVTTDSPSVTTDNAPIAGALPVYYTVDGPNGRFQLAREFHEPTGTEPIAAAITDMIGGADDTDYQTLWRRQTTVNSAVVEDDVIVVDLGDPALTSSANDAGQAAVQQLVYTATAAASVAYDKGDGALPVQILVDGAEPPEPLRSQLNLGKPVMREPELKMRQLVQIDNPAQGTTVTSPVTVDGSAVAFEGTLHWSVSTIDGRPVDEDNATAEECCKFSPFTFQVELEPGTYEVAVSDTDPSGGEGFGTTTDTKSFTVTK